MNSTHLIVVSIIYVVPLAIAISFYLRQRDKRKRADEENQKLQQVIQTLEDTRQFVGTNIVKLSELLVKGHRLADLDQPNLLFHDEPQEQGITITLVEVKINEQTEVRPKGSFSILWENGKYVLKVFWAGSVHHSKMLLIDLIGTIDDYEKVSITETITNPVFEAFIECAGRDCFSINRQEEGLLKVLLLSEIVKQLQIPVQA